MKERSNKKIFKRPTLTTFFITILSIFTFFTAKAQIVTCTDGEKLCGVTGIVETAIKIADTLLGIVAGVALLFFVVAGILMILSGGQQDRIAKGKSMMINSVIGLVICLLSWTTVYFVQTAIGLNEQQKITAAPHQDSKIWKSELSCLKYPISWRCKELRRELGPDDWSTANDPSADKVQYTCVSIKTQAKYDLALEKDKNCVQTNLCPVQSSGEDATKHVVYCCSREIINLGYGVEYTGPQKCPYKIEGSEETEKCKPDGGCDMKKEEITAP